MHFNISVRILFETMTFSPLKRSHHGNSNRANTQLEDLALHQAIRILQLIVICVVVHLLGCFISIGSTLFQKLVMLKLH